MDHFGTSTAKTISAEKEFIPNSYIYIETKKSYIGSARDTRALVAAACATKVTDAPLFIHARAGISGFSLFRASRNNNGEIRTNGLRTT